MLVHHLPLGVAPLEDTGAARAELDAVGQDPVQTLGTAVKRHSIAMFCERLLPAEAS